MKTFISEDFLLYNSTAKELYHNVAKDLPIIDYHNHLNQYEIQEDKNYENLSEIWLAGDHYKWRAMRANGIAEEYITGNKSPYEKFLAWAETVPKTFGNPLYHWTHLELLRYFEVDDVLNSESAPAIWEAANKKLQTPELSVRSILKKDKVEFVGTTDDPVDDLQSHQQMREEGYECSVSPSFRPDKGLNIEAEGFSSWVSSLEAAADVSIKNYAQFLDALAARIEFFDQTGCKSADHGINVMFYENTNMSEVEEIFSKRMHGEVLTSKETEKFKTLTLTYLGEHYAEKGWVMQLHIGPLRNNHTRMFESIGPDSGFDSIGDRPLANKLSAFMDGLAYQEKLPKTILYSLNANDYDVLASMAGNYQNAEIPGKIQFGTAWWFNDTIDGMEKQMKTLANIGLISNFVGMLTDSRSFLSISRHEYFRRILCNLLGTWVEEQKVPKDMQLLENYVRDICYANAKNYFQL